MYETILLYETIILNVLKCNKNLYETINILYKSILLHETIILNVLKCNKNLYETKNVLKCNNNYILKLKIIKKL